MEIMFKGDADRLTVETDPDAAGARVYLNGSQEKTDKVQIGLNGQRLSIETPEVNVGSGTTVIGYGNVSVGGRVFAGRNIVINGDDVIIDGRRVSGSGETTPPDTTPLEIHVVVPARSRVSVSQVAGATEISGSFEDINAASVSGAVRVHGPFARAAIKTTSGSTRVDFLDAHSTMSVNTVSGKVRVEELWGDIEVKTVSGSVRFDAANPHSANIKTVSGDVEAGAVNDPNAMNRIKVRTVSGDRDVAWRGEYTARYRGVPEARRAALGGSSGVAGPGD